jgi:hypothetical protein
VALDEWATGEYRNIDLSEAAYKPVWQSIYDGVRVVAENPDCGFLLRDRLEKLARRSV